MSVTPPDPDPMIVALLRLFALRPLLTLALFGIPVVVLVVVGLFTILALKLFFFIVLPILVVVWLVRKVTRSGDAPAN
jgi:type IV secretory pathway VirB3-like protein